MADVPDQLISAVTATRSEYLAARDASEQAYRVLEAKREAAAAALDDYRKATDRLVGGSVAIV